MLSCKQINQNIAKQILAETGKNKRESWCFDHRALGTTTCDRIRHVSPDVRQVVEVAPHMLTEEDIRRVATVLLGDIDFYERRSSSHPKYSKSQYQEMINRLSPYATKEGLTQLMGASGAEVYLEYVKLFIESWTEEYETAQEGDPRTPCDWVLKKERVYNDSEIEIGNRVLDEDMNVLYANAKKDGIEYCFSVLRHSGKTHKLNSIHLQLSEGIGLMPVDQAIYRSMLCRTENLRKIKLSQ